MAYQVNFKHQGVEPGVEQPDGKTYTEEEAQYVWADFTKPQTIDEDGRMILYLNEETMNELNSFSKRLIIQLGYVKVTKVKVLTAAELPDVPELSVVAFDKSELTLEPGQSEKITATIKPASDASSAKWSSSDTSVATVDNEGNVTAVGGGNAVITCETANAKATCEVSVIAIIGQWRQNQTGQWIYGDEENITCYIGDSPRLYITTIPENASVTFSASQDPEKCASYYAYASSKNAEVSFSNGKTGKVEITVKLNGTELTKTFSVTAIDYPEMCLKLNTSNTGNPDFRNILAGKDFKIDASVRCPGYDPYYGDEDYDKPYMKQKYTWTISDPTVAMIKSQEDANSNYGAYSNIVIVGLKTGKVTVTASVTSADGTSTITGTTQELSFMGHGEVEHQFYFRNDRGGSWTSTYNVGSIEGNGIINDIVLHGTMVDMNLETATTVGYIPKFTAGQVFSFKATDPNVRIMSIKAAAESNVNPVPTFGDKTKCSTGSTINNTWTAPEGEGVEEVTFTVLDDMEVVDLRYWTPVLYRYATPELVLSETELGGAAGNTKQLSVEVANKATEKVLDAETIWTSADPAIASVDENGLVTFVSNGETEITADYNGTKAVCKVTVAGQTAIDAIGSDVNDAPAEYFNLQGMRVDASNLTPGIYILRKGNETQKVIIK